MKVYSWENQLEMKVYSWENQLEMKVSMGKSTRNEGFNGKIN